VVLTGLAERYIRFADDEARDRSALYESLARGVAGDAQILDMLSALTPNKQQPNLLFAAVDSVAGTSGDFGDFRRRLLENAPAVRSLMLSRSTQTNEPARWPRSAGRRPRTRRWSCSAPPC
jgi:hypothetical protein